MFKILCFWQINKHIDLHNEIENPETEPRKYVPFFVCGSGCTNLHGRQNYIKTNIHTQMSSGKSREIWIRWVD